MNSILRKAKKGLWLVVWGMCVAIGTNASAQTADTLPLPYFLPLPTEAEDSLTLDGWAASAECFEFHPGTPRNSMEDFHYLRLQSSCIETAFLFSPTIAAHADSLYIRLRYRLIVLMPGNEPSSTIGFVQDTSDSESFIEVGQGELAESQTEWVSMEFNTTSLGQADVSHLALRLSGRAILDIAELYIDTLHRCAMPGELHAVVDSSSIHFSWGPTQTASEYRITLNDSITYTTSEEQLLVEELNPNSSYRTSLIALCDEENASLVQSLSVLTTCGMLTPPLFDPLGRHTPLQRCHLLPMGEALTQTSPRFAEQYMQLTVSPTHQGEAVATMKINADITRIHIGFDVEASAGAIVESSFSTDALDTTDRILADRTLFTEDITSRHIDLYADTLSPTTLYHLVLRIRGENYKYAQLSNLSIDYHSGCHPPTRVYAAHTDPTYIDLAWTDYSAYPSGYEVRFSQTDTLPTADSLSLFSTDTALTLYNLEPDQIYYFWVRSLCAEDSMRWVGSGPIRTFCGEQSMPFTEDFESFQTDEYPLCWTYLHSDSTQDYLPSVSTAPQYVHSGSNGLSLRQRGLDVLTAVLPELPERADNLHVSFYALTVEGDLEAGLIDMRDSSFTRMLLISGSNGNSTSRYEFYTDTTLESLNQRVAFRWHPGTRYNPLNNTYALLDDIRVEAIGSCRMPDSLSVEQRGTTDLDLRVYDSYSHTGYYRLLYGFDTIQDSLDFYGFAIHLDSLEENQYYELSLRAICYDNSLTQSIHLTAATACSGLTHADLPLTEDFESRGYKMPPCWIPHYISPGTAAPGTNSPTIGEEIDNHALFFNSHNAQTVQLLALQPIDFLNDLYLSFDLYAPTATVEVGAMDNPYSPSSFTLIETLPRQESRNRVYVSFENYYGTGQYIAFRISNLGPASHVSIDNLQVDTLERCRRVVGEIVLDEVYSESVSFHWTTTGVQTNDVGFRIYISDSAGTLTETAETSLSHYGTYSLQPSTLYSIYVEQLCGGSTTAFRTDTLRVRTFCGSTVGINTSAAAERAQLSTAGSPVVPLSSASRFSASQQIYTETGGESGTISALLLNCITHTDAHFPDCRIYMAHTADTLPSHWTPTDSMTLVYDGSLHTGTDEWRTIPLHTPFHYNGQDNLLLCFEGASSEQSRTAEPVYFGTYSLDEGSTIYLSASERDSAHFEAYEQTSRRAKIRLEMCQEEREICSAPVILDCRQTDISININFAAERECEVYICEGAWWNHAVEGHTVQGHHYTFEGLRPNRLYTIGVRQRCAEEEMSQWTLRRVQTDSVAIQVPEVVVVTDTSLTEATIQWGPLVPNSRWVLHLYNNTFSRKDTVPPLEEGMRYEGLLPNVTYHVRVRGLFGSAFGTEGPWSEEVSFRTLSCRPVSTILVQNTRGHSAEVSWTDEGGGTRWKLEYGYAGFDREDALGTILTTANPCRITGLSPNTMYDVYVATVCDESHLSVWSDGTTFDSGDADGILSATEPSTLRLYPNPAADRLILEAEERDGSVELIDINGRTVVRSILHEGSCTLDVHGLGRGVYFVRLLTERGTSTERAILK